MKRRQLLYALLGAPVFGASKAASYEMSVEGYIFQQYAQRQGKPLAAVIPEVLPMAREAGFKNVELNPSFFAPEIRNQTLSLLSSLNLKMPSIYVGGAMHTEADANHTIDQALEYAHLAAPYGCRGVVNNPDPKSGDQQKTDEELKREAEGLNRMAGKLMKDGFELRVHHHTPQLENGAREWRYILAHTDAALVKICVDVDWAYEGGFEPVAFLKEVGERLSEIHVRSARNKLWLEDVEDSDIDYREVAVYLKQQHLNPVVVVELAYRPNTVVTRSLEEDLVRSRVYTERVLGFPAGNHIGL
jgi:sugar phosphate isomerase/epimerase